MLAILPLILMLTLHLKEEVIDDAKSCFCVIVKNMVVHIKTIIKLYTDPFNHVN
jgi:hypothetical protein